MKKNAQNLGTWEAWEGAGGGRGGTRRALRARRCITLAGGGGGVPSRDGAIHPRRAGALPTGPLLLGLLVHGRWRRRPLLVVRLRRRRLLVLCRCLRHLLVLRLDRRRLLVLRGGLVLRLRRRSLLLVLRGGLALRLSRCSRRILRLRRRLVERLRGWSRGARCPRLWGCQAQARVELGRQGWNAARLSRPRRRRRRWLCCRHGGRRHMGCCRSCW